MSEIYSRSFASSSWYSSSDNDPVAITRNRLKSGLVFRPQPSAILVGMEELDRWICEIKPNISSFGNEDFVSL